jgi:hypothetical protein
MVLLRLSVLKLLDRDSGCMRIRKGIIFVCFLQVSTLTQYIHVACEPSPSPQSIPQTVSLNTI